MTPLASIAPETPLPINFGALCSGLDLPAGLSDFFDEVLARKARSRELGQGPRLVALDSLIETGACPGGAVSP